ncbi:uncharacterized protein LOC106094418 [Stomoxys calcitrans]|uniref:BED-type domain-containing protein n=1 Tax=Stomoxys calcitrans TaxID=35570 RepID=A0A1I8PC08_STOCA|nr:uncharacterized protein LOC106094418 [Stomoxys calcitrans]
MNESENECNADDSLRPRKRSLVWGLFEKLGRYRVRCRLCAHEQNYQGTTGNILRHLKSKHGLDATIKGQQEPEHQERLKTLLANVPMSASDIKVERNFKRRKSSLTINSTKLEPETEENPYESDGIANSTTYVLEEPFENYIYGDDPTLDPVSENEQDNLNPADSNKSPPQTAKRRNKANLDEERVMAEIEYYRQRADYFKLQKHLTALQAKKIRIEIEQLTKQNNNSV